MPESKNLNAIIIMIIIMITTTFVNSRNEYVTENEIMDKAILDEVDVKFPAKLKKSFWVTLFRKYGIITLINNQEKIYAYETIPQRKPKKF